MFHVSSLLGLWFLSCAHVTFAIYRTYHGVLFFLIVKTTHSPCGRFSRQISRESRLVRARLRCPLVTPCPSVHRRAVMDRTLARVPFPGGGLRRVGRGALEPGPQSTGSPASSRRR